MLVLIEEGSVLLPADGVAYSRVAEGGVLLSTEQEVYYGLNEVGARVWELMGEARTVGDICEDLRADYPNVDADTLERDVKDLLADLVDNGLVRCVDGGR